MFLLLLIHFTATIAFPQWSMAMDTDPNPSGGPNPSGHWSLPVDIGGPSPNGHWSLPVDIGVKQLGALADTGQIQKIR